MGLCIKKKLALGEFLLKYCKLSVMLRLNYRLSLRRKLASLHSRGSHGRHHRFPRVAPSLSPTGWMRLFFAFF